MNYAASQFSMVFALLMAIVPVAVNAAAWTIVPSIETTLTYADNITTQAKGNEEAEVVLEIKPAVRVQSSEGRTQLDLAYGINNLYYADVPDRKSSQQLLRGNGSAELLRDTFFVNATGFMSYQAIEPAAATNIGVFSQDSTQVATWSVSPYFQQTFGGAFMLQAGINLNIVNYKEFLSDSFAREYFFNASSGPVSDDFLWRFDVKSNDTYYDGQLSDFSRESAELDLRYKILPEWALTGRMGYVDYKYKDDTLVSDEPKGKTWRAGAAWLPSARTALELGVSRHFFDTTKYGSFSYQGRGLFVDTNYEEVVTTRRQLQTDLSQLETKDTATPLTTVDGRFLTETEDVFVNKSFRIRSGYKSDELSVEVFGYRDRRLFQKPLGTQAVAGGGAAMEFFLSRRASLKAGISRASVNSMNSTRAEITDISTTILRTFGTGLKASINIHRNARKSTDTLVEDYVANFVSTHVLMEF